jgi:hypothetical protein
MKEYFIGTEKELLDYINGKLDERLYVSDITYVCLISVE